MDRTLVEAAQHGDRDAFERLARAIARRLYLIAYRIVRDSDRADDAVQQALVAIWRELPTLRDPEKFDGWTYRVVVRFCLADVRRTRVAGLSTVSLPDGLREPRETRDEIREVGERDEMERAFLTLTPQHRAVVVLHHYAGLSLAEIAKALGVPYGTVGSRLHHATRALRASLEANDRDVAFGRQQA